jgi:hypothetical protein
MVSTCPQGINFLSKTPSPVGWERPPGLFSPRHDDHHEQCCKQKPGRIPAMSSFPIDCSVSIP